MFGPIIIDTNLLLLLVVGGTNPDYILMHKRLRSDYTVLDFEQVSQIVSLHSDIVLLPNTATEVSNFARHIEDPARSRIQRRFRDFLDATIEVYVGSREAALRDEFVRLGLTDAAILHHCAASIDAIRPTLLSVDEDLINCASSLGYGCIDYTQLR